MRTGRKFTYSPSFLRSATLMLWWPPADRSGGGPFEPDARHFERRENFVGNQLSVFGQRARAGFDALPFHRDAGRIHCAYGRFGYFGSDAVAGDERNLVGHHSYYRVGGGLIPDWAAERRRNGRDATAQARHSRRARAARHAGDPARRIRPAGDARSSRTATTRSTSATGRPFRSRT